MRLQLLAVFMLCSAFSADASIFSSMTQAMGFTKIQEPTYTVLKSLGSNAEVRQYPATKWVQTTFATKASDFKDKTSPSFWKLFNYISGQNSMAKKIEMTSPVLMAMTNSNPASVIGMNSDLSVDMKFYVDKSAENDMPVPNDATVKVAQLPAATYATIRFGGYATMADYIEYRDRLVKALGDEAAMYDSVNMISAGYDAPFKFFNRRNEVWLVKKN